MISNANAEYDIAVASHFSSFFLHSALMFSVLFPAIKKSSGFDIALNGSIVTKVNVA